MVRREGRALCTLSLFFFRKFCIPYYGDQLERMMRNGIICNLVDYLSASNRFHYSCDKYRRSGGNRNFCGCNRVYCTNRMDHEKNF